MRTILAAAFAVAVSATGAVAEGLVHKVALHIDQNDRQTMNIVLNNARNLTRYYAAEGDEAIVEIVAHGPGLQMFIEEVSPVKDRIAAMSLELENLSFSACGNTIAGLERKTGQPVNLIEEANVVTSGAVRLIELQEQGYAYLRP